MAEQLRDHGYAVLQPQDVAAWLGCELEALLALNPDWETLPPDEFLKDGGRYRFRRHASFTVTEGAVVQVPHTARTGSRVKYNALHGGMERWFAPMLESHLRAGSVGAADCQAGAAVAATACPLIRMHHAMWRRTNFALTRPAVLAARHPKVRTEMAWIWWRCFWWGARASKAGETRVFEATGPSGLRFTLTEPWSLMLLDDARMIHESTPIQPLSDSERGARDTLVVTCRAQGFQGDADKKGRLI